jgi:sulfite exporter TauE/SafE
MNPFPLLTVGLLLGMEHALDADHVVAVSTIVSESRSLLRSLLVGVVWGIGHTVTLLLVGLVVLFLGIAVPSWVALSAEFLVGLILILLGVQILWRYNTKRVHAHYHDHGDGMHIHFHAHEATDAHSHRHEGPRVRKPLLVGMVHGFAGSAALLVLVLSTIQSPLTGVLYILIFGLGSIVGMLAVSALIGLPFLFTLGRFQRLHGGARVLAGLLSIGIGFSTMLQILPLW